MWRQSWFIMFVLLCYVQMMSVFYSLRQKIMRDEIKHQHSLKDMISESAAPPAVTNNSLQPRAPSHWVTESASHWVSESASHWVWETSEWSFKIADSASLLLTEWSVKVLKVSSVTSEAESETLKLPRRLLNSSCLFGGSRWHVTPCRGQQRHHGLFHSCVL